MLVRGQQIPEHTNLVIGVREGATLRKLLSEVKDDDKFNLNEFEDEIVTALVDLLTVEDGS